MDTNRRELEADLLVRQAEEGYLRTKEGEDQANPILAERFRRTRQVKTDELARLQATRASLEKKTETSKPVISLASNRASMATSVKNGGAARELHCRYAVHGGFEKNGVDLIWEPFPRIGQEPRILEVRHGPVLEHCEDLVELLIMELVGSNDSVQIQSNVDSITALLALPQGELIPRKCDDGMVHGCLTDESLLRHSRLHVLNANQPYAITCRENPEGVPIGDIDSSACLSSYINSTLCILRTNAQVEYKGKVRVSTLHNASVTNTARSLTPRLLQLLNCFEEIAAGDAEQRTLVSGAASLLGCADISDATGNNTHQENYEWIDIVSDVEGLSQEERLLLKCLMGPQRTVETKAAYEKCERLEERKFMGEISEEEFILQLDDIAKITLQSSHMGIGVGWPFFNIKIAYLCYLAGIETEESTIMGDDLTNLAEPEKLDRIITMLELYRLPVNRRKSYNKCNSAVFCENLYTIYELKKGQTVTRFAVQQEILPLGQASMKRVREDCGVDDIPNKRAGAINLNRELNRRGDIIPKATRTLGRKTAEKYLRIDVAGPAIVGGEGRGSPSTKQLARYIASGACPTTKGNQGGRTGQRLNNLLAGNVHDHIVTERVAGERVVPAQALKTALQKEAIIVDRFSGAKMRKNNNTADANLRAAKAYEKKGEMLLSEYKRMKSLIHRSDVDKDMTQESTQPGPPQSGDTGELPITVPCLDPLDEIKTDIEDISRTSVPQPFEGGRTLTKYPKWLNRTCEDVTLLYHMLMDSRTYSAKAKRLITTLMIQSPKRISRSLSRSLLRLRDAELEVITLEHYDEVISRLRPTQRVGGKMFVKFKRYESP